MLLSRCLHLKSGHMTTGMFPEYAVLVVVENFVVGPCVSVRGPAIAQSTQCDQS